MWPCPIPCMSPSHAALPGSSHRPWGVGLPLTTRQSPRDRRVGVTCRVGAVTGAVRQDSTHGPWRGQRPQQLCRLCGLGSRVLSKKGQEGGVVMGGCGLEQTSGALYPLQFPRWVPAGSSPHSHL